MRLKISGSWVTLDERYVPDALFPFERDISIERSGSANIMFGDSVVAPNEITLKFRAICSGGEEVMDYRDGFISMAGNITDFSYETFQTPIVAAFVDAAFGQNHHVLDVVLHLIPAKAEGLLAP